MTKGDGAVEQGAEKLEQLAEKAEQRGTLGAKLADELHGDADFLRKLKPSLVLARAKGELPTDGKPGEPRRAPSAPQLGKRPKPKAQGGKGRAIAIVAGAFAAGIAVAKLVDWRGHAHPRI